MNINVNSIDMNPFVVQLRETLPIGQSFDVLERQLSIGGKDAIIYFVDGLVDGEVMQRVMEYLLKIQPESMTTSGSTSEFIKHNLPFLDTILETKIPMIEKHLFAGLIPIVIEGMDQVVIIDNRSYPSTGISEPSKEKSLRGAKDGFTETMMTNVALIRRRIRDSRLIFKAHIVGEATQTDTCVVYIKGIAEQLIVDELNEKIKNIKIDSLTVGEQSLIELIIKEDQKKGKYRLSWLNPFPKVRYTQRPDVVAAHITEGKIAIIVDNSPTVILLPAGIFDFLQDVDDYYFPALTGNYFRLVRLLNELAILFLTPIYLLLAEGFVPLHDKISFILPVEGYALPLFWQFLILEIAIDALKLASLNTPDSLGMSLSVIGALILGEFSVSSGWFIPQAILCMAVVALAGFTQPSIELGYAIKFIRILMLIGVSLFGIWGLIGGLLINVIVLASTKTLAGTSYLYPLIPWDGRALKHLFFRTKV